MELQEAKDFRDRPLAVDKSGKRKLIFAKQPKGKWYTLRSIFAIIALAFLVLAPIIKVKGNPLMLFDIAHRKFYIFGQLIWAQDTYLLALIMIIAVVGIVLFTVVYGRLFCGWACPQTIFMEHVFRRIEYLFDGKKPNKGRNSKQDEEDVEENKLPERKTQAKKGMKTGGKPGGGEDSEVEFFKFASTLDLELVVSIYH